jgi:hypothetical protein
VVNTAWVDAFDDQDAAATKLRRVAKTNRALAKVLQSAGAPERDQLVVIEG